jgi:hypothetical protein
MTTILLNQLRSTISTSLISFFCKNYEENEIVIRKSIDTAICSILIGLDNVIKNNLFYDKIIESIAQSDFLKDLQIENGKIYSINYSFEREAQIPLHLIFSIKKNRISEMISNEVGIKSETALAILNFTSLFVLSHLKIEKQKAAAFTDNIKTEKTAILSTLPEGLRVLLGYSDFKCDEETLLHPNTLVKSKYSFPFLSKIFDF